MCDNQDISALRVQREEDLTVIGPTAKTSTHI